MTSYAEFLERKAQLDGDHGFEMLWTPTQARLFDFQEALVAWQLRKGRGAVFADCGLGKTAMQLTVAENIVRKTGRTGLILTPLAVANQTVAEGEKFGIEVHHSRDGKVRPGINVTNYERLHLFSPDDFGWAICDESSAIKAMTGKRRNAVTYFMRKMQHRMLCTATPAPNDYIELGTASEALGYLGQRDMLAMFFRSTDNLSHVFYKQGDFWNKHKWMFRPHAEGQFWRWVCSWARAVRRPSDLGFADGRFVLPPLNVTQHVVDAEVVPEDEFLPRVAVTLKEQRGERRATMEARCAKVEELVRGKESALVWCHMNDEGDELAATIPGAVQVAGSDSDDVKEERLMAFSRGEIRVLVTKPTIAGFGMNWQHCGTMTFFPSHSYEQYYQGVRRCWRFGRSGPVDVHVVTTPGEAGVTGSLQKKSDQAEAMFARLVEEMNNQIRLERVRSTFDQKESLPSWL